AEAGDHARARRPPAGGGRPLGRVALADAAGPRRRSARAPHAHLRRHRRAGVLPRARGPRRRHDQRAPRRGLRRQPRPARVRPGAPPRRQAPRPRHRARGGRPGAAPPARALARARGGGDRARAVRVAVDPAIQARQGQGMNKTFGNDDARSTAAGLPDIQVAALDARHLEVLARASGARRAVEIGTLGGYSGVAILRGLAADGELDTIDSEPRHAEVARESFRRAGFADRARVHVGLALDVLPRLERRGPFDLVFIDADKEGYPRYLDWAAQNLRPGGIVLLDNAFLFGDLPEAP